MRGHPDDLTAEASRASSGFTPEPSQKSSHSSDVGRKGGEQDEALAEHSNFGSEIGTLLANHSPESTLPRLANEDNFSPKKANNESTLLDIQTAIEKLGERLEKAESQHLATSTEKGELAKKLQQMEEVNAVLESEVTELRKTHDRLFNQIDALHEQENKLIKKLLTVVLITIFLICRAGTSAFNESTNTATSLRSGIKFFQDRLIKCQAEKNLIESKLNRTHISLLKAVSAPAGLTLTSLHSNIESLDGQLSDISESQNCTEAELQEARARLLEASATSAEARTEVTGLREQLRESQASKNQVESELQQTQVSLLEATSASAEARAKIVLLQSNIKELTREGEANNNSSECLLLSSAKRIRIAVGGANDYPLRMMLNHGSKSQDEWDQGASMNLEDWYHKMDFWAYPMKQPGTIRIAVGETHTPHRVMFNDPSLSQEEWNEGHGMSVNEWTHKMEFWAYPSQRPGTIPIDVGEAQDPHRLILYKREDKVNWASGWTHKMEFWVYPTAN